MYCELGDNVSRRGQAQLDVILGVRDCQHLLVCLLQGINTLLEIEIVGWKFSLERTMISLACCVQFIHLAPHLLDILTNGFLEQLLCACSKRLDLGSVFGRLVSKVLEPVDKQ